MMFLLSAIMFYRVWIVPVSVTILVPATFIITYIISVENNHVNPVFPYISDTGTLPPESCIFGQLLNISSLLVGLCMYLRHRQIVEFHRRARITNFKLLKISTGMLWLGYMSTFGLTMVANFQETSWFTAHILGATFAFGFGMIYIWAQTVIGFYLRKPLDANRWMSPVRFTLCLLTTIFFIMMTTAGFYLVIEGVPPFRLKSSHKAHKANLVATISEWFMVSCFILFFITFAFELRHAVLTPPKLILSVKDREMPHEESFFKTTKNTTTSKKSTKSGTSEKSSKSLLKSASEATNGKSSSTKSIKEAKSGKSIKEPKSGKSQLKSNKSIVLSKKDKKSENSKKSKKI